MVISTLQTFILLAIIIALLLAFLLLTLKTKRKLSNNLFAIFLILSAIDISGLIPLPNHHKLAVFRSLMIFLHMPVFYWYISSVCYTDFKLNKKSWLHFIPFIAVIGILLPSFFLKSPPTSQTEYIFPVILLLFHIQVAVYLWWCFRVLQEFKELYINNFAGEQLVAYHWLKWLTLTLALFYLLALFKNAFKFGESSVITESLKVALLFFELFVFCWYLFTAISKPELFRGIVSKISLNNATNHEVDDSKIQELQSFMLQEKPFLNPDISVKDIAGQLNISSRELSILLNRHLEKHFFDFINEYRIKEAKSILKSSKDAKLTILEVLYQVGFNSKSSFNTAFKKHTGLTPTSYRKSL